MRSIIWIIAATLAAGYLIFAFATLDRSDDKPQVEALITRAAEAVQKRDLGGAISCVSETYKDPTGMNYDKLRLITAQALRIDKEFRVEHKIKSVDVVGNAATVDMSVTVRTANGRETLYKRDMTVCLAKEKGWHALVVPATFWRVTKIDSLGLNLDEGL